MAIPTTMQKKKMAAALAAVNLYLQDEAASESGVADMRPASLTNESGQWSLSGRQEMMTMRRLSQLRVFHRGR